MDDPTCETCKHNNLERGWCILRNVATWGCSYGYYNYDHEGPCKPGHAPGCADYEGRKE
jgi:hypothetical protein